MKTTHKILTLIALSLTLASLAPAAGIDSIGKIARAKNVPGKFEPGKCLVFATALADRLNAAGADARVVVFDWSAREGFQSGRHALVVFKDGGRTYVMDNMSWTPKWVRDGDLKELAQTFSGPGLYVASAQQFDSSSLLAAQ